MNSIASRVASRTLLAVKMDPKDWKQSGNQWMYTVRYSGGKAYDWAIKKNGEKFVLGVRTPEGDKYETKKDYDSKETAMRVAWKFINRADGADLLEKELGSKFQKKGNTPMKTKYGFIDPAR